MRVLLTGASGNVGTALLERLRDEADVEVVGLARRPPDPGTAPYDVPVRWVAADLSTDDLGAALEGVDAVVHAAWLLQPSHQPQLMRRVNVDGTRRLLRAAVAAGVTSVVHLSSVGAYAPGPKDRRVEEDWPTTGIASSLYSRQKAEVESFLDELEGEHPDLRVVRVRPGVVLSEHAAAEQVRYFLGPLVPAALLRPGRLPVLPLPDEVVVPVVAASDLADLLTRALRSDLQGGLNATTTPDVDGAVAAETFGARHVSVPLAAVRAAVTLSWKARLQPTDPGWVDLGSRSPLLSTRRAREELGWSPQVDARTALRSAVSAARSGHGAPASPVLRPLASVPRRLAGALRRGQPPGA